MDTRRDPAHPRPADDDRAHQARDAARLGLVGRRLQRRHRRACARSCWRSSTARARTSSCRCRAAARSRSRPRSRRSCRSDGHVLVLDNGAYCKRLGRLATLMGRRTTILARRRGRAGLAPPSSRPRCAPTPSITHVGLIHCETGTGVLNPLQAIADVCARHGKGLIVDAMSSFAALPIDAREVRFDALVAASGKCLEGVPGMGFVFIRKDVARRRRRQLALAGDGPARPARLHGEDRPVALHAADPRRRRARRGDAPVRRRGRPAGAAARATPTNCDALVDGMAGARLRAVPDADDPGADHRHLPRAGRPAYDFKALLRSGQGARLHPLSGQADAGRDVPRRLHRRDRAAAR